MKLDIPILLRVQRAARAVCVLGLVGRLPLPLARWRSTRGSTNGIRTRSGFACAWRQNLVDNREKIDSAFLTRNSFACLLLNFRSLLSQVTWIASSSVASPIRQVPFVFGSHSSQVRGEHGHCLFCVCMCVCTYAARWCSDGCIRHWRRRFEISGKASKAASPFPSQRASIWCATCRPPQRLASVAKTRIFFGASMRNGRTIKGPHFHLWNAASTQVPAPQKARRKAGHFWPACSRVRGVLVPRGWAHAAARSSCDESWVRERKIGHGRSAVCFSAHFLSLSHTSSADLPMSGLRMQGAMRLRLE